MALSINELLDAVDEMELYKKDYDVIQTLLDTGDDEFFVKMLEEVLMGNLYWSDFEHNLANTNYPEILKDQLKSQAKLNDYVRKIIFLRKSIDSEYEYDNSIMSLGLVNQYGVNEKTKEFYQEEFMKIRGNLLYDLTESNPNDTVLEMAFKTRIYNALRNGEILLQKIKEGSISEDGRIKDSNGDDTKFLVTDTEILVGDPIYEKVTDPKNEEVWSYYEFDGENYYLTEDTVIVPGTDYYIATQEKHEYINPNDIFLHIQNYIIPVHSSLITLDSFDRTFMNQHKISEDTMKQIKMQSLLLREKNFIGGENGNN